MKQINIVCHAKGTANVTTEDIHISNEDLASKIVIDFSELSEYTETNKWLDIKLGDGTSLRQDMGTGDIVELEMDQEITIPGVMILSPFIWDGLPPKIKFRPDKNIVIHYQPESGEAGVILRDDYIASLEARIKALEDIVL